MMAGPVKHVFEKFEADLKEAVTLMDGGPRMAVGLAARAAWEFVAAHEEIAAQGLDLPLYHLVAALGDLHEGRAASMLKPAKVKNRPPDSTAKQIAKAYACFCIDLLMSLGDSVENACKAVADILAKHEISFSEKYGTPHWRTIKHWRDE